MPVRSARFVAFGENGLEPLWCRWCVPVVSAATLRESFFGASRTVFGRGCVRTIPLSRNGYQRVAVDVDMGEREGGIVGAVIYIAPPGKPGFSWTCPCG